MSALPDEGFSNDSAGETEERHLRWESNCCCADGWGVYARDRIEQETESD